MQVDWPEILARGALTFMIAAQFSVIVGVLYSEGRCDEAWAIGALLGTAYFHMIRKLWSELGT